MKKTLFYITLLAALVTAFLVVRATIKAEYSKTSHLERSCGADLTPKKIRV